MSLFDAIFGAKSPYGTPPFGGAHPQTGGAQMPTTPETMPVKHGFSGFIDRALNPTNALGQFGQALVASGGGPLGDAMAYMMKARMLREYQKLKGPHFEHIGDSFGIVDDSSGAFTPTYTAPHQASGYSADLLAAGIDPASEEGKGLLKAYATNRADPITSIPLPGGQAYIGPRSGLATLGQPSDPAPANAPPAGGVPGSLGPSSRLSAKDAWGFIRPHEGGYSAHDGNGAAVNYGINQGANPDVNVASLTPDGAEQIFEKRYWGPSGAANLPAPLAAAHADTYFINPARAKQFLQDSGGDVDKYLSARESWLNSLGQKPGYERFAKAWATRDADLRTLTGTLGASAASNAAPPASYGAPVQIATKEQFDALPSGTPFIAPDGTRRVKP